MSAAEPRDGDREAAGARPAGSARRARPSTKTRAKTAADKRRAILDAGVRVFARQGFHACRVADIADEAGVAYGLVYHYFASKDEILDTLFLERWAIMLETIRHVDAQEIPAREKLAAIASFIIDSYTHNPDLMKVIIVEVTRAANSFGQTHLAQIRQAFTQIAEIVTKAQADGEFRSDIDRRVRGDRLLRSDRAGTDRLDLRPVAARGGALRAGQAARRRDDLRRTRRPCRGDLVLSRSSEEERPRRGTSSRSNRLPWQHGERRHQAPDVVRPAGGDRRAVEHRRAPHRHARMAATVRRGAARVSASPAGGQFGAGGRIVADTAARVRPATTPRGSPPRSPRSPSARPCWFARRSSWRRPRSPRRPPSSPRAPS